jgi:hypothetical protein
MVEEVNPGGRYVTGAKLEYCAGLDLGQKNDYTALALLERQERVWNTRDPVTWDFHRDVQHRIVHLDRMPLGTSYPRVVDQVKDLLAQSPVYAAPALVVDSTGVGKPVLDLVRARGVPGALVPVTITAGLKAKQDGAEWHVPKRELIVGLQVAFETGRLTIERDIAGVDTLVSELMAMRVRVGLSGHERFEAWREGAHDDLVLAVALAWWEMNRKKPEGWRPQERLV